MKGPVDGHKKSESEQVSESVRPRSIVADSEYPGRYRLLMYLSSQYVMFASITHCIIDTRSRKCAYKHHWQQADTALYVDPSQLTDASSKDSIICVHCITTVLGFTSACARPRRLYVPIPKALLFQKVLSVEYSLYLGDLHPWKNQEWSNCNNYLDNNCTVISLSLCF